MPNLLDQFRNLVGIEFSKKLNSYNESGRKYHEVEKMKALSHPLFPLWYKLKIMEIEKIEAKIRAKQELINLEKDQNIKNQLMHDILTLNLRKDIEITKAKIKKPIEAKY